MHKATARVLSSLLISSMVVAFLLALSPSASAFAHHAPVATPSAILPASTARTAGNTSAPTATAVDRSQPGSTNGLVLMSVVIVLIIVIPILLQRALWAK